MTALDAERAIDWAAVRSALDAEGYAVIPGLVDRDAALALAALWTKRGASARRW